MTNNKKNNMPDTKSETISEPDTKCKKKIIKKDKNMKDDNKNNNKIKKSISKKKLSDISSESDEISKNDLKKRNKKRSDKDKDKDKITKEEIIELFLKNIKGNKFDKTVKSHDGEEGQWLEKLMNLKPNASNTPDLGGYEMKKDSKKISFGDWSAEYLFSLKRDVLKKINKEDIVLTKEEFIKIFGNKTKDKENRYSWSGSCVPKYGKWNDCGQTLKIDKDKNIIALYSYEKDKRKQNQNEKLKGKEICIAVWSNKKMEKHVNSKFNQKGFFICKKNKNMVYDKICFGPLITYELFIEKIKSGDIFFDSGMYFDSDKPNERLYSQWRASQNFWNNLLIEEF
jgi:hypothetical protein